MPAAPSASVFINCPFDKQYQPIFDAIVFCVVACGFEPRCTLELTDAGEVRIENIYRLIAQCNHSIQDISRTEVEDQPFRLPRFNMPLELGIFLGAKRFGRRSSRKRCLIMDRAPYRYKRFISDIGGQDIKAHCTRPVNAIRHVRDWLQSAPGKAAIPGGTKIWQDYQRFRRELPVIAEEAQLDPAQLTFIDYLQLVTNWLKLHR
jgi:uncharacterized protein YjiS (DUF1127 family)